MENQLHDSQVIGHINLIFDTFMELHGDRKSGDDGLVIGGLARLDKYKMVVISYQFDSTNEFPTGPGARGYRKCSRLANLAENFARPVILLIDIPEAFEVSGLEEQANAAIALNLEELSGLATPLIGVIIGRSNGIMAIDLCAVDRILMLENATCCISLPGEASVNGADPSHLCLSAQDLLNSNIINRVVNVSPEGDSSVSANILREAILEELNQLVQISPEDLVQQRLDKLQSQFRNFDLPELSSIN